MAKKKAAKKSPKKAGQVKALKAKIAKQRAALGESMIKLGRLVAG